MKSVFGAAAVAALCLCASLGAAPSRAQGGGFMWCSATASNGADTTRYYSSIFSASADQAAAKAAEFKSEVEDAEISAASVTASCHAAPDQATAFKSLNAARNSAPGKPLDWPG